MTIQEGPLLSLCMKTPRASPIVSKQQHDGTVERLAVMLTQDESIYNCRDYLSRRRPSTETPLDQVDTLCREKMCEWSYRVMDHFHANREIVAVSISYLDRFMDRVAGCDRSAFKLAAMTTLYMATKVFSDKEISMTSLAELSRGEFDMVHMMEMETIILQTLSWRMHPPTTQCFIHHLCMFLPQGMLQQDPKQQVVLKAIHQRACFFAELALFDYCFVSVPKWLIGLCALLNAMEGLDSKFCCKDYEEEFLHAVEKHVHDVPKKQVESLCSRLWYLYSQSAQFYQDDVIIQRTLSSDGNNTNSTPTEEPQEEQEPSFPATNKEEEGEEQLSPVSVSRPA